MCLIRNSHNEKEDAVNNLQKYNNKTHIIKKILKIQDSKETTK